MQLPPWIHPVTIRDATVSNNGQCLCKYLRYWLQNNLPANYYPEENGSQGEHLLLLISLFSSYRICKTTLHPLEELAIWLTSSHVFHKEKQTLAYATVKNPTYLVFIDLQETLKIKLTIFCRQWRIHALLVKSTVACPITKNNVIIWERFTQLTFGTDDLNIK